MNEMFNIRKATIKDAESILRLAKEMFYDLGHQLKGDDQQSLLFCKKILKSGEYVVFLSTGPQEYANGIITLSEGLSIYAGGKFGVIREFYIIPEMRSTGVGKALLEKAKEFGRKNGWKRIEVTSPEKRKWPRTHKFYVREGFREIGPRLTLEIGLGADQDK
jgi:GNAT superfamily N-acetyltransferase